MELSGVSCKFGDFELKNIDISVSRGDIVYLVGRSGSGKSTLLRLIAGLDSPISGSISINHTDVFSKKNKIFVPPEERKVGMVFQYPSLFPSKNVLENVIFAVNDSVSLVHKKLIAMEALLSVGMHQYYFKMPYELSGGQQQLVVLARSIAQGPEVMLLDEPFSSLDVISKRIIREKIINQIKNQQLTAIFVTHDPDEALMNADMIYIIDDGEILSSGTPNSIYYSPKNAKIAMLFGEINQIIGKVEDGVFKCDFGEIPLHSDDACNEVYVRPEGIILSNDGKSGVNATIENIYIFNKVAKIKINNKIYSMHFPVALIFKRYDTINVVLDHDHVLFL